MALIIDPNYNLFIQIMFIFWVVRGLLGVLCGLAQTDRHHSEKYGVVDIISGGIVLLLATWVLV